MYVRVAKELYYIYFPKYRNFDTGNFSMTLSICEFYGQTFIGVFGQFSFTTKFFGLKMQNRLFFKEKWF